MKKLILTFLGLMCVTMIFAQADSTFVTSVGNIVTTIFGKDAGESTVSFIFKLLGYAGVIDGIIMVIASLFPSESPTRSFLEKVLSWIRAIVGDKKKYGGYFKPN